MNLNVMTTDNCESTNSTKLSSTTTLLPRNPDFLNRGILLSQIEQRCSHPASCVALVGAGGVGKSQLALEYANRIRERSSDTSIFWVCASNVARFDQGYRDIADCLGIAGREESTAELFKRVNHWLRGCDGKWLMVFDGFDEVGFLADTTATVRGWTGGMANGANSSLSNFLPRSQNGSVLITTRSRDVAMRLADGDGIMDIESMNASDAVELLNKKLGVASRTKNKNHLKLVKELEFLPLAIAQAAAYISKQAPHYSVRQYLQDFRKANPWKTMLLLEKGEEQLRDWEAKHSLLTTWHMSFDQIHLLRPSAVGLLALMSFFDRDGIHEYLVRGRVCPGNELRSLPYHGQQKRIRDRADSGVISEYDQDGNFEADVQILQDYSFISIGTDRTFRMNALTQAAMQSWLKASRWGERWKHYFIRHLLAKLPHADCQDGNAWRAFYPHAKAAAAQRPRAKMALIEWSHLLYPTASYVKERGCISEAIDMSTEILGVGGEIVDLARQTTENALYDLHDPWQDRAVLLVQATEMKRLGEKHSKTLVCIKNLIQTYIGQERWDEAEQLLAQSLETSRRVLSEERLEQLISMSTLIRMHVRKERLKETEELAVRMGEMTKWMMGEEDSDILARMDCLDSIHDEQGQVKKTRRARRQVFNEFCWRVRRKASYVKSRTVAEFWSVYDTVKGTRRRLLSGGQSGRDDEKDPKRGIYLEKW